MLGISYSMVVVVCMMDGSSRAGGNGDVRAQPDIGPGAGLATAHRKWKKSDALIAHMQSMPLRIPMTSTVLYTISDDFD